MTTGYLILFMLAVLWFIFLGSLKAPLLAGWLYWAWFAAAFFLAARGTIRWLGRQWRGQ